MMNRWWWRWNSISYPLDSIRSSLSAVSSRQFLFRFAHQKTQNRRFSRFSFFHLTILLLLVLLLFQSGYLIFCFCGFLLGLDYMRWKQALDFIFFLILLCWIWFCCCHLLIVFDLVLWIWFVFKAAFGWYWMLQYPEESGSSLSYNSVWWNFSLDIAAFLLFFLLGWKLWREHGNDIKQLKPDLVSVACLCMI